MLESGPSNISVDSKGRLAIPSCYREFIRAEFENQLTLTLNPKDPALWLYPRPEWNKIKTQLLALPDFKNEASGRTKQVMCNYAHPCEPDAQGRILLPKKLRAYAELSGPAVLFGRTNKIEIWNEAIWDKAFAGWRDSGGANSACEDFKAIRF